MKAQEEKQIIFPGKSVCEKNQKIISCSDKHSRSVYRANNKTGCDVFQYLIDGDIYPASTKELRCDYLIENNTGKKLYFIELKGCGVDHACEQILNTRKQLSSKMAEYGSETSLKEYGCYARIVYTHNSTHNVNGSHQRELLKVFDQKNVQMSKLTLEEDI